MSRFRRIKKEVREFLIADDWQARLSALENWSPGDLVSPLFNLRLDRDEIVRWRAVTVFGLTAARLAEASMEKARVLMRTCMWHMNEESGNLGWGIPLFMAEAMVRNEKIAKEYHKILASYIFCDDACDGNYLDHTELRRDVFWGLARLAGERPDLVAHSVGFLLKALNETDPYNRAYAAWTLGNLGASEARDALKAFRDDAREIRTYRDGKLLDTTVGAVVREALERIG